MAKQRMGTRERLQLVDKSVQARLKRVRKRLLPIMQIGLAAGPVSYTHLTLPTIYSV